MLQPFENFQALHLQRLVKLNITYLVSQSYTRGNDHFQVADKTHILITDYDDLNYASVHFNAVKADRYASIIHLSNPMHRNKLDEMIHGDKYRVYWSIIRNSETLEKQLTAHYKDHLKKYLRKSTDWKIASGEQLMTSFEVIFGELFLQIRYKSEQLRVKFEEIEKS